MNRLPVALMAAVLTISLSTITACDDQAPDVDGLVIASPGGLEPDLDAVGFREPGPPHAVYVTEWNGGKIRREGFKAIVDNCVKHGDPALTCTLSWYDPDTSTAGGQVVGIGCSMVASDAFVDCHRQLFLQNGGQGL